MNETVLCGIDSSTTRTGISRFINGEYTDCILLDHKDCKDLEYRTSLMIDSILQQLDQYEPDIIVIEDDWNKNNVQTTKALSEIIGAVHGYSRAHDVDFHKMLPSTWRSYLGFKVGGKKRDELKQMAIDYVSGKYGLKVNDDVAESCCIAEALINYFETQED
jgi:Holliday junction resolvasome RuvABC endonuclease subunit